MLSSAGQRYDYSLTLESDVGLRYYTSSTLLERHGILVVFTARSGGVSPHPYGSLNLAFHVGDYEGNVIENRERLCRSFDLDLRRMVCAEQVHGIKVGAIGEGNVGQGAFSIQDSVREVDALVTNTRRITPALFFADCVPVILVELEKRVVGVVHAGWRGVYGNIVGNAVAAMASSYSMGPGNLLAFIGPAIGGCCYQVSADLTAKFSERFSVKQSWMIKDRIDLRTLVKSQLIKSGVTTANVYSCDECCTSCRNDLFFSYRADGGKTGRHAALATIL